MARDSEKEQEIVKKQYGVRSIRKIIRNVSEEKKITVIFKTLEEYHEAVNKELIQLVENKNIDEDLKHEGEEYKKNV